MKHIAMLQLHEDLFDAMADLCHLDPAFPRSWPEWQRLIEQANLEMLEAGIHLEGLMLRPTTFKSWCEHVGIVPGLDALKAYAVAARTPHMQIGERAAGGARAQA